MLSIPELKLKEKPSSYSEKPFPRNPEKRPEGKKKKGVEKRKKKKRAITKSNGTTNLALSGPLLVVSMDWLALLLDGRLAGTSIEYPDGTQGMPVRKELVGIQDMDYSCVCKSVEGVLQKKKSGKVDRYNTVKAVWSFKVSERGS